MDQLFHTAGKFQCYAERESKEREGDAESKCLQLSEKLLSANTTVSSSPIHLISFFFPPLRINPLALWETLGLEINVSKPFDNLVEFNLVM